jgi:hypothetical protein
MPPSQKTESKDSPNTSVFGSARYHFHDGSIIAIEHAHQKVRIAMESAEISVEYLTEKNVLTKAGTIKGILTVSGSHAIEVDGKKFKDILTMRADSATILDFDVSESKVHFFVEWINYPQNNPDEEYMDIVIEADAINWEHAPDIFDPYNLTTIEERFVIPLIILAAPNMKEKLADPLETHFHALANLSAHIVESYRKGALEEIPRIFNLIERLLKNGEKSVKEAATIGFLEGVQNLSAWAGISPEVFIPWLGHESKRDWDALNNFWDRKK